MLKATKNQNKSSGPAIWYEHAVQEKNCKDRLGVKYIQQNFRHMLRSFALI